MLEGGWGVPQLLPGLGGRSRKTRALPPLAQGGRSATFAKGKIAARGHIGSSGCCAVSSLSHSPTSSWCRGGDHPGTRPCLGGLSIHREARQLPRKKPRSSCGYASGACIMPNGANV